MITKINQKRCKFEQKMHQKWFGSRTIPAAPAGFRGKLERAKKWKNGIEGGRERERGERKGQ